MYDNLPRLKEATRDLFVADWLFSATNEIQQKQTVKPDTLNVQPWKPNMPQYFSILYASLQPLAGGMQPQVIGPFASPQAAIAAATQLAGLVSQLGGYSFAQPAALNPGNVWQLLSQGVAMQPQQKPGNWGGWLDHDARGRSGLARVSARR